MTNTTSTLPPNPTSPVVNESKMKLLATRLFGLLVAGLFILFMVYHHYHKQDEQKSDADIQPPTLPSNLAAPTLTLTPQQASNIDKNINQLNTPPDHDIQNQAELLAKRMSAPVEAYTDGSSPSSANSGNNDSTNSSNSSVLGAGAGDANSQFIDKVSASKAPTEQATRIQHLSTTLAQGNIIQATLETRIASDLPGMVTAVTSKDIYSEDNSNVLIPRGSRLIGQYSSAIAQGQNRVFVVWQRLIRPDGIDIQLGSPGTDALGTAGIGADAVDHHFWQQFGTAMLLSVIGTGAATAGVNTSDQYNSLAAYRSGLANSLNQTAQNNLSNMGVIKPTIYINQGTTISVFVARDLDFYNQLQGEN